MVNHILETSGLEVFGVKHPNCDITKCLQTNSALNKDHIEGFSQFPCLLGQPVVVKLNGTILGTPKGSSSAYKFYYFRLNILKNI